MINIIFDENVGSFFFACEEEEDMTLEEEIMVITQKIFALYAANMTGDSVETFKKMAEYIVEVYEDPQCKAILDDIYESNKECIFLNNESVDEAMGVLLKSLMKEIDQADEEDQLVVKIIAALYCETLGIDPKELLKEEKIEELDDNEEDLF